MGGFFSPLLRIHVVRGPCTSTALERAAGNRDFSDFASLQVVAADNVPRETVSAPPRAPSRAPPRPPASSPL